MTFFLVATKENWRFLQNFELQCHWKLCAKIPPYVHCKSPRQQAVWKLLSEISRTAPEYTHLHNTIMYAVIHGHVNSTLYQYICYTVVA